MRHGIFGAFGAAGPADDVLHLRERSEEVLGAMVRRVDLRQRGLGGQHRLDQERALVQPRHEVTTDEESQHERGNGERRR